MALVRRAGLVGRGQSGQVVAAAVGHAAGVGAAPEQARFRASAPVPEARSERVELASANGTGAVSVAAAATGPFTPARANGEAAAAASQPADPLVILLAFGLVGLCAGAAYLVGSLHPVNTFRVGDQMSTFGALFVFAAAVERLLEPLSQWLPGIRSKAEYERAIAAVVNDHPQVSLADVVAAKVRMDRARANRTVLVWGVATGVATVVSSAGGFYLLRMLAASPDWSGVSPWVDALITGLVVGSGTKPLHDIISRVQKGKEQAEDPATR